MTLSSKNTAWAASKKKTRLPLTPLAVPASAFSSALPEALVQNQCHRGAGGHHYVAILGFHGALGSHRSADHAANDGAFGTPTDDSAQNCTRRGSAAYLGDVTCASLPALEFTPNVVDSGGQGVGLTVDGHGGRLQRQRTRAVALVLGFLDRRDFQCNLGAGGNHNVA